MTALFRYFAALTWQSQRLWPPTLLLIAVLTVLTGSDNGPLAGVYALAAADVFVCGTWLTMVVLGLPDPVQRGIASVQAGGARQVLFGSALVAVAGIACYTVIGTLLPLVIGDHRMVWGMVGVAVLAQLTCGFTAVAVGSVCSKLVFRRPGHAVSAAVLLMLALLLVPGLPPVHPLFRLLANGTEPGPLLAPVSLLAGISGVLLISGVWITHTVAIRRD